MDQTICAFAYDNSRERMHKWVGKTNPNGPKVHWAQRDHSNGDMASALHCWRITLQACLCELTTDTRVRSIQHPSDVTYGACP